ncbi:MAG: hypothetical protein C0421_05795 [Hyphomonas sp.]|uniref:hypothetical protein n=1 Tax=Hyphomonas sp. TaxID=87 RepID=UPI0025B8A7F2|nr:hypothetical protein [Hyphomonas sp.]MBA4338339.1 hypothetical protein [Hyphomonas sp.]
MSAQVYYYVSRFNDEVPPHEPTLESAAYFLQTGRSGPDDPDCELQSAAPFATPGDIIELDTLEILFDTYAQLLKLDDGMELWQLAAVPPEDARFAAIRWNVGLGWDADTIFDPWCKASDLAALFADLGIEDERVENIAIGRTGEAKARFDLDAEGRPTLTLVSEAL